MRMKHKSLAIAGAMAMGQSVITRTKASINASGELMIYGVIGDWWDELDAETVVRQAENAAGSSNQLIVRVHSEGGNVMDGIAIYNALRNSEREVVVYVDGIAASMASAVVCAGDVVRMPSNALMMIHKPWLGASGNADDLRTLADQLEVIEGSYIDCYAQKGNQSAEEIQALIADGKDHWLTAAECQAMGLCDEVLDEPIAVAASFKPEEFHNPPAALWGRLAVKPEAAAAAQPSEKKTMKFKIVASGGGLLAAAIVTALGATYASIEDAVAGLSSTNIDDLEKILAGDAQASDEVLAALANALDVSEPEPQSEPEPAPAAAATAQVADVNAAAEAAVQRERTRVTNLQAMGKKYGLTDVEVNGFIGQGLTEAQARSAALDIVAARTAANQPVPGVRTAVVGGEMIHAAMALAILHRVDPLTHKIDDAAKPFAHMSLMEMAKAHLSAFGVDTSGMNPNAIAAMAMQSTSDFVGILADVANKSLRAGYEAAPRTFTAFSRRVTASDFKPINRAQLGSGGGALSKVNEHGEYKHGTLVDGKESYQLATYGEIIAITRQTLINDDLSALSRIPMMQGAQVSETESKVVWDLILNNAKLSDNKALFHADHGNLGSGVIGETGLNAMRKSMRTQTKLDGKTPINLTPAYLIVPAALETTAQKNMATITPDQATSVNPFAGTMQLLVEARLDAASEAVWYGAADPNRIDTIEYCYLEGEEGAYLETRAGFNSDGVEMKVRLDFGAGLIDYRGLYKSTGF